MVFLEICIQNCIFSIIFNTTAIITYFFFYAVYDSHTLPSHLWWCECICMFRLPALYYYTHDILKREASYVYYEGVPCSARTLLFLVEVKRHWGQYVSNGKNLAKQIISEVCIDLIFDMKMYPIKFEREPHYFLGGSEIIWGHHVLNCTKLVNQITQKLKHAKI